MQARVWDRPWWKQMCCAPRLFHENLPSQLWKNEGFNGLALSKEACFQFLMSMQCQNYSAIVLLALFHPKWGEPLMQQRLLYPSLCCWMFTVVFCHPPLKKQMSKHSSKNHQTTNHEPRQKKTPNNHDITLNNPPPKKINKITTKTDLLPPWHTRDPLFKKKHHHWQ